MVLSKKKSNGMVGLDLEAASVAATEVRVNGRPRVVASGIQPLGPGVFHEGEVIDTDALAEALKELFGAHTLSKTVRVGVANHRIAVRTLRLPLIEKADELETAIRFQAQDQIPMPLDQAVLQHQVVNRVVGEDGERRMDVVVVAARRDMVISVLEAIRRAGLRPAGIDLSAFGMIRALAPEGYASGSDEPAASGTSMTPESPVQGNAAAGTVPDASGHTRQAVRLYCNLGDVTNLAVARGSACEFTRVSGFGMEGAAQRLAEKRGLALEHARQWLIHVGLERTLEELDGDPDVIASAREVLAEATARLVDELRLSLEFYGAQEGAHPVEGVVACGPGTTIPGLVERLQLELGLRFDVGRPRALASFDDGAAARLTLPYGLALEG